MRGRDRDLDWEYQSDDYDSFYDHIDCREYGGSDDGFYGDDGSLSGGDTEVCVMGFCLDVILY